MTNFLKSFFADDAGVTAMEYGMIAALISVVIITTLGLLGNELNTTFSKIQTALVSANATK